LWPSAERITELLSTVRFARQELRDAGAAVPEHMRSSLEPPPEGVIRHD